MCRHFPILQDPFPGKGRPFSTGRTGTLQGLNLVSLPVSPGCLPLGTSQPEPAQSCCRQQPVSVHLPGPSTKPCAKLLVGAKRPTSRPWLHIRAGALPGATDNEGPHRRASWLTPGSPHAAGAAGPATGLRDVGGHTAPVAAALPHGDTSPPTSACLARASSLGPVEAILSAWRPAVCTEASHQGLTEGTEVQEGL